MNVAVITGATGFIGSHLARKLVGLGWSVHAFHRQSSSLDLLADCADSIHWHNIETTTLDSIWDTIGSADVVYHLATEYGRGDQPASEVAAANVLFPLRLLEHADAHDVELFVTTDTCFPASYPYLREYTLSKKQFSQWGKVWAQQSKNRFVNLVLQHPFGPGDRAGKFVPWIIDQCLRNVEKIELTSGEQQKDFIFVDDVVEALIVLHDQREQLPIEFSEVPCGSGTAITLKLFIETIHSLSQSTSILEFGALPNREGEMPYSCADNELLTGLGWSAAASLSEGIRLTLAQAKC